MPLRSNLNFSLGPGLQKVVGTRIFCTLPAGMHGIIMGPTNKSLREPWVAPGILFNRKSEIMILISNLTSDLIKIVWDQKNAFLYIEPNIEIKNINEIGDFKDIGLPVSRSSSILSLVPRESLEGLLEQEKIRQ